MEDIQEELVHQLKQDVSMFKKKYEETARTLLAYKNAVQRTVSIQDSEHRLQVLEDIEVLAKKLASQDPLMPTMRQVNAASHIARC